MNPNAIDFSRRTARAVALMLAAALTACASSVPLKEAPTAGQQSGTEIALPVPDSALSLVSSIGTDSRSVSPVQIHPTDGSQPHALARLVYFDFDSFVVKPEYAHMLEANARYLMADGKRRLALEGHTDERGGREYNLALGQQRAETVRRALTLLGVSDEQVEPVSFGEEKAAMNGLTEDAHAANRRVEFTYR